jgi:hypothetical protein
MKKWLNCSRIKKICLSSSVNFCQMPTVATATAALALIQQASTVVPQAAA